MKNVFIIGSKGIPANYGGYETFVHKLTQYKVNENIKYHVACLSDEDSEFTFNDARCFNVPVPKIGAAKAVAYDIMALKECISYIKDNNIEGAIIYILACRIGPFLGFYMKTLKKLGITLLINPDGHEWLRSKWNYFIKKYWKLSESMMIKRGDLIVCDSIGIEKYIKTQYKAFNPNTTYIAYGADMEGKNPTLEEEKSLSKWYNEKSIKPKEYYLMVGRFVPENNYETIIREFMKSDSKKDLVIVCNLEENKFYNHLKEITKFEKDSRVKFVGTVYDEVMISTIRKNAFGYFHGHEVGGTNPSLIEALATTEINILLDVIFNTEVAEDTALYFTKDEGSLKNVIKIAEKMSDEDIAKLSERAKINVKKRYSWDFIVDSYEKLFMKK
jgi:rhamnosyltransferase